VEIAELLALDPGSLSRDELRVWVVESRRVADQAMAALLRVYGEWNARQVWGDDSCLSGKSWLAHHVETAWYQAGKDLDLAAVLRRHPVLADASASGALGSAKVALIGGAVTVLNEVLFAEHVDTLVTEAKRLSVDATRRMVTAWKKMAEAVVSPDPNDPNGQAEPVSTAHVSVTLDGMVKLDASLNAEAGAIVKNELHRLAEQMYQAEAADGFHTSPAQRTAAALVEMAKRSAAAEAGRTGRVLPSMLALTPIEVLKDEAKPGMEAGIVGSGKITAATARRLACNAKISRVITGPDGEILDLGRTARLFSPAQRLAMIVRDGGCAFPTCTAPPAWCECHHLHDWIKGGLTNLDDGAMYCDRHHHLLHDAKFTAQRRVDGTLEHRRPDGTIIPAGPSTRPKPTHQLFPLTETESHDRAGANAPAGAETGHAAETREATGDTDRDAKPGRDEGTAEASGDPKTPRHPDDDPVADADNDPAEIERLRQLAKARARALRPPPTRAA
jgi:hypothetical protein